MMLGMIAVVEPEPLIKPPITAYAPSYGHIGIAAIMAIKAVEGRQAIAQIIKGDEKEHKFPVQQKAQNHKGYVTHHLEDPPGHILGIFLFQLGQGLTRIIAEIAIKRVFPHVFRLTILAIAINREPINGIAGFILNITIAHVVTHMHAVIKGLGKPNGQGFNQAKEPVEEAGGEIGVVDKVVRDAVDIPGDADGIHRAHEQQQPPRGMRKHQEHGDDIGQMPKATQHRDNIPGGEGK